MTLQGTWTSCDMPNPIKVGHWYWLATSVDWRKDAMLVKVNAVDDRCVAYESYEPGRYWGYRKTGYGYMMPLVDFQENSIRDYSK